MPFDFRAVAAVAQAWFAASDDGGSLSLDTDYVITRPYGWVLFGRHDLDLAMTGSPAILIDRINGELRVLGTGLPLPVALARYESTVPAAWLSMTPEVPSGAPYHVDVGYLTIHADKAIDLGELPEPLRRIWLPDGTK